MKEPAGLRPAPDHSRCWYYRHTLGVQPRRCVNRPDYHDGPHEYEPARKDASR